MFNEDYFPISDFLKLYYNNLAQHCIPDCFADLCSGWTQETFRQVVLAMTKKGTAPIKLWFDSNEEMCILSNKRAALIDIFKLLDTLQLGRIDTLELFAAILISIEGRSEVLLNNIMLIFGFSEETEFSKDEFHFFLDCMFRGIMKFAIPKKENNPVCPGKKIRYNEIEQYVSQIYEPNTHIIDRGQFIENMQNKNVSDLIKYFHTSMFTSAQQFKIKTQERIQITHFVRRMLLEVTKQMWAKIKEIEDKKQKNEEEKEKKIKQQEEEKEKEKEKIKE